MTITERQRNELYQAVDKSMGEGPADTLMALLPPVGWADVATKHDLDTLGQQMATKVDLANLRADFEKSLNDQTKTLIFGLAALNATFLGALLAGTRLLGG